MPAERARTSLAATMATVTTLPSIGLTRSARPAFRDDFSIAIVCALPLEFDAVCLTVDEFWDTEGDSYGRAPGDQNLYTTGRIGSHNVVLVLLPGMGKVSGASTAASLRHSYVNLKLVILAGVCGGIPNPGGHREIVLGDVVISQQIVQFDLGRQYPGLFVTKDGIQDTMGRPGREIRTLLATIQTEHGLERLENGAARYLSDLQLTAELKGRKATYLYPGTGEDHLFPPEYTHRHKGATDCECFEPSSSCPSAARASCEKLGCDLSKSVSRHRLADRNNIQMFLGNVGSGDTVMKSGEHRDRISSTHNLIAFEMEGAGIWDEMPCIIVKGVSDYADSHKHKLWQPFAAAAAAAATKAVIIHFVQLHRSHGIPSQPEAVATSNQTTSKPKLTQKKIAHEHRQQTYRLRNIPANVDKLAVADLVVKALSDLKICPSDIKIYSLANAVDWYQKRQDKIATLSFKGDLDLLYPPELDGQPQPREWRLRVPGLPEPLLLDTHFEGLTVLNAVHDSDHRFDCIALPGLVGHPFQCWQPLHEDQSFMWIRDALPGLMPGVRFFLYGYPAAGMTQRSTQTITDLARTLMLALEASGWSTPTSKPLLFMAYSLGGVVLKKMSVLLADGNERAKFILNNIRGAIFFGCPSRGMPMAHLLAVLGGQPNRDMIEDLANQSEVLANLETQFSGVSYHTGMKSVWAYETQPSAITINAEVGNIVRAESFGIIVDRISATSGWSESDTNHVVQIDESHLDMTRFGRGHHQIPIWAAKLNDLRRQPREAPFKSKMLQCVDTADTYGDDLNQDEGFYSLHGHAEQAQSDSTGAIWQHDLFLHSITFTEKNQRFSQIEENFEQTFYWAFDDLAVGLTKWLRSGNGIFWVSGKPGSGKSTFMKFLLKDPRTAELMHSWRSQHHQVTASFFFHHRGTYMQKSFEGLLRGLLGQLLEQEPGLFPIISAMMDTKLHAVRKSGRFGTLDSDIRQLFQSIAPTLQDHSLCNELTILLSVDPSEELDYVLADICPNLDQGSKVSVKRELLLAFQKLSKRSAASGSLVRDINSSLEKAGGFELEDLEGVLSAWRYRIDFHRIARLFLQKHKLLTAPPTGDITGASFGQLEARDSDSKDLRHNKLIDKLVDRHTARQQLHFNIQLLAWNRADLEEAVRRIFDQDILDLRVCLFFDALDEYDGRPEVIADFLKDLTSHSTSSRTKARVLFSSRSWPVFQDEFGGCPTLQIHEHTREDIRDYCIGILQNNHANQAALLPLADAITNRAQGVFLWVKLLLHELGQSTVQGRFDKMDIEAQLKQHLKTAPTQLHEYYTTIIQRLPTSSRREAYVLLECLSKTTTDISIEQIPMLLSCGLDQNPMPLLASSLPASARRKQLEAYLNSVTGGLVNLVSRNAPDNITLRRLFPTAKNVRVDVTVQLMHQTCKEWVEAATFKHVALGSQDSAIPQNGHSFLTRFWAYQHAMFGEPDELARHAERFCFHAIEAERTTGFSQYEFLRTLSDSFYQKLGLHLVDSAVSFAIHQELWLYLEDAVRHDETSIAETEACLFSLLWRDIDGKYAVADSKAIKASKLLFRLGFRAQIDPIGISRLLGRMWLSQDAETIALFDDLIQTAISTTLPVDTSIPRPRMLSGLIPRLAYADIMPLKIIHLSSPRLVKWILDHYPNQVNYKGIAQETPLDYLAFLAMQGSELIDRPFDMDWLFELLGIFVQYGGFFCLASDTEVIGLFHQLSRNGYDVEPTMQAVAPGLRLAGLSSKEPCWTSAQIRRPYLPLAAEWLEHRKRFLIGKHTLGEGEISGNYGEQQQPQCTEYLHEEEGLEPVELDGRAIEPKKRAVKERPPSPQKVASVRQARDLFEEFSVSTPPSLSGRSRARKKLMGIFGRGD
ncbi:ankyrin repeat domain-containing protein 50 [Microdochium nivale]|nr:ankyrin repeat domain-containing protein 50 [Microdochium nivale]